MIHICMFTKEVFGLLWIAIFTLVRKIKKLVKKILVGELYLK